MSFFIKLLQFLNTRKEYFLYPLFIVFFLLAILIFIFQGPDILPWIYTIF